MSGKYCVECRYGKLMHIGWVAEWRCAHPKSRRDPVTGNPPPCREMRKLFLSVYSFETVQNHCGPEGKWWESKMAGKDV